LDKSLPLSIESLNKMEHFRSTNGFGALSIAARMGLNDLLTSLLTSGASADFSSPNGCTALHEAVIYNNIACAETLIKHCANIEARMALNLSKDQTCLTFAALTQRDDMTRLLLSYGASLWHRDIDNPQNTALHLCGHRGGSLAILLDHEPRLALAQNSHGRTALHYSASSGSFGNVKRLCEAGADPCVPDVNNSTPFHLAWLSLLNITNIKNAYLSASTPSSFESVYATFNALANAKEDYGPLECMSYLESRGADTLAKNREGNTPSISACRSLLAILNLPNGYILESQRLGWTWTRRPHSLPPNSSPRQPACVYPLTSQDVGLGSWFANSGWQVWRRIHLRLSWCCTW